MEHSSSVLKNNDLYIEHGNCQMFFMYERLSAKLPRLFGSFLNSVAAVLRITKLLSPIRAFIDVHEQRQVMNNFPNLEVPLS